MPPYAAHPHVVGMTMQPQGVGDRGWHDSDCLRGCGDAGVFDAPDDDEATSIRSGARHYFSIETG